MLVTRRDGEVGCLLSCRRVDDQKLDYGQKRRASVAELPVVPICLCPFLHLKSALQRNTMKLIIISFRMSHSRPDSG